MHKQARRDLKQTPYYTLRVMKQNIGDIMNKIQTGALLVMLALGGPASLMAAEGVRMKCWTNQEGVRECGNRVPPEYIQQGYTEIDGKGFVRDVKERAKTPEELVEAKRLAKLKAAEQKQKAEQETRDRVLLRTFSSVNDIERARDNRVAALEGAIKLAGIRNENTRLKLNDYIKRAAESERMGKTPAAALLEDIEALQGQIENNDRFIAEKRAEQAQIRQAHALDIERYKRLKGME